MQAKLLNKHIVTCQFESGAIAALVSQNEETYTAWQGNGSKLRFGQENAKGWIPVIHNGKRIGWLKF